MKNINTVNVLNITDFANMQIEAMASYPDTPEGNKAAEAKFIEWCESIGKMVDTKEEIDDCLDGGIYELGAGGIIITHSTEPISEGFEDNEPTIGPEPKEGIMTVAETFQCPRCGGHSLEEVMIDVVVTSEVVEVYEGGDLSYGSQENTEGSVDHYQCAACGWVFKHGEASGEELYEFLKGSSCE